MTTTEIGETMDSCSRGMKSSASVENVGEDVCPIAAKAGTQSESSSAAEPLGNALLSACMNSIASADNVSLDFDRIASKGGPESASTAVSEPLGNAAVSACTNASVPSPAIGVFTSGSASKPRLKLSQQYDCSVTCATLHCL